MRDIVERLDSKEPLCWQDVKEAREEIVKLRKEIKLLRSLNEASDAISYA